MLPYISLGIFPARNSVLHLMVLFRGAEYDMGRSQRLFADAGVKTFLDSSRRSDFGVDAGQNWEF